MIAIRLQSTVSKDVYNVCSKVKNICKRLGINVKGPVHLPTRILLIKHYKKRIRVYRCKLFLECDEIAFRRILSNIDIPNSVKIEVMMIKGTKRS